MVMQVSEKWVQAIRALDLRLYRHWTLGPNTHAAHESQNLHSRASVAVGGIDGTYLWNISTGDLIGAHLKLG